ncbi:hypothetical protein EDC96DRAFT_435715, partial [Choanephora cucurbitarum]
RIAETLRRQSHVRIMKSNNTKEFATVGVMFNEFSIVLYAIAFDSSNTFPYQLYEVKRLMIPSSPDLYTNMEETFENLKSFKTCIVSSLAEEADANKPCIYHDCIHLLKPTIGFTR